MAHTDQAGQQEEEKKKQKKTKKKTKKKKNMQEKAQMKKKQKQMPICICQCSLCWGGLTQQGRPLVSLSARRPRAGWSTALAGTKAYLWSLFPMFLAQLVVLAAGQMVVQVCVSE